MYKGVCVGGGGGSLIYLIFLKYPMTKPNYFNYIGYLKTEEGRLGAQAPLVPPLCGYSYYYAPKNDVCKYFKCIPTLTGILRNFKSSQILIFFV